LALLPRKKDAFVANHQLKTTVPELDCSMLSPVDDKEVMLGEGAYGITRLIYFNCNFPVALKDFNMNYFYEVEREAAVISELQHHHHQTCPTFWVFV